MGRAYLGWFLIVLNRVPQFHGIVVVVYSKTQQTMIIYCIYFLFYIVFSNNSGRNQLAYETYDYDFSLFCLS